MEAFDLNWASAAVCVGKMNLHMNHYKSPRTHRCKPSIVLCCGEHMVSTFVCYLAQASL